MFRARALPFALAMATTLCFSGAAAEAQTQASVPAGGVTYDAITSYAIAGNTMTIAGIVHGAAATSTDTYQSNSTTEGEASPVLVLCERQILVAINRPGRFSVTLNQGGVVAGWVGSCTLTRLP